MYIKCIGGCVEGILFLSLFFVISLKAFAISGGAHTSLLEHPWQLKIKGCGAVLISRYHALTAAHCTASSTLEDLRPSGGGSGNLDDLTLLPPLEKVVLHPEYNGWVGTVSRIKRADIAILFFSEAVTLSETLQPIEIPDDTYDLDFAIETEVRNFSLTGWGQSDFVDEDLTQLKVLENLDLLPQAHRPYWDYNIELLPFDNNRYTFSETFKTGHYLAIRARFGQACKGDSGGPLVDNVSNFVIGLSAHLGGKECGKDKYFYYTNVSFFSSWIRSEIEAHELSKMY